MKMSNILFRVIHTVFDCSVDKLLHIMVLTD